MIKPISAFYLASFLFSVSANAAPPSQEKWEEWRKDILDSATAEFIEVITPTEKDIEFQEKLICKLIERELAASANEKPNYTVSFLLANNATQTMNIHAKDAEQAKYYAFCQYTNTSPAIKIKNVSSVSILTQ